MEIKVKKHKAYKFRIYPNKEQEILIAKTIGCSRFIFNHFLAKREESYKATRKGLSYVSCSKESPSLKSVGLRSSAWWSTRQNGTGRPS
ncbi:helix-turn-helix domain-containing protein [Exiguobacterium sp. s145]|uniref:helix-turn-helix domain-containing protein n=1 Tax=Exiguobacterium sp. s145 TaxID=2751203 RepID=UPI00333A5B29